MKDKNGNELAQGDLVLCRLTQPYIIGRILNVKTGGLSLTGDPKQVTPDVVTIVSEFGSVGLYNPDIMTLKEPKGN